jgi:hypothetical protein
MPYTNTVQIVAFICRNPKLTVEEFYKRWSTVHAPIVAPWAEKHGIISYRQHHSVGMIVPNLSDASVPNVSGGNLPTVPVAYDGFVVWVRVLFLNFMSIKTDNILRRKCRAWNLFLKPFKIRTMCRSSSRMSIISSTRTHSLVV